MPETASPPRPIGIAKLIAAALIALGIWHFLVALTSDTLAPWIGELLGQNPTLPVAFTRNYDYGDLAISGFELIVAAILAAMIHYLFSPSQSRERSVTPISQFESAPASVPAPAKVPDLGRIEPPPLRVEPVSVPLPRETVAADAPTNASVSPAQLDPVPPPAEPRPLAPPVPVERLRAPLPVVPAPISSVAVRKTVISPHEPAKPEPVSRVAGAKPVEAAPPSTTPKSVPAPMPPAPANPFWVPPPRPETTKVAPAPPPAAEAAVESKPEPAPGKKKAKRVYYNIVGEPIMEDDE